MAGYRLFGSELSPYSVKLRSYLRYKKIPHEWIVRTAANQAEFQKYAKLPLIPLLIGPDDVAQQDSTPIIEALETRFPTPPLQPADPALAFLSALIEEYADEWLNKPMFHYRWHYEADQVSTADRIAANMLGAAAPEADRKKASEGIRQRMTGRLPLVGSNPTTQPIIESSLRNVLDILEPHLSTRVYLFGGRPVLGDLGVWAQLYEMYTDPTAGALIRSGYPRIVAWIERMLQPAAVGDLEGWASLSSGLSRLLREQVAGLFLPWSTANAQALARNEKSFSLPLGGHDFSQECQKYHARSLAVIREKFAHVKDDARLRAILAETGCLAFLE